MIEKIVIIDLQPKPPRNPRTHCKNGHDKRKVGTYKHRECKQCQLDRANRRNAAQAAEGCTRCGGPVERRLRRRYGKEHTVRYCAACAKRHSKMTGEPTDVSAEASRTERILELATRLESSLPWERQEIRAQIARVQEAS